MKTDPLHPQQLHYCLQELCEFSWRCGQPKRGTCELIGPFVDVKPAAFCSSCFLFLVGNCMDVLVRGGGGGRCDSLCNKTPENRIFDDLHSPSRFCHCWAIPARRDPTYAPSLGGGGGGGGGGGDFRRSSFFLEAPNFSRLVDSWLPVLPVVAVVLKKLPLDLFCCLIRNDCWLPPWPTTEGPNLWCTEGLAFDRALGVAFFGILKWLVRYLCRAFWSRIVKISSDDQTLPHVDQPGYFHEREPFSP